MRLDHDCIRDILLYIEENTSYENSICFDDICSFFSVKYSEDVILYHVDKITEANFVSTFYASDAPQEISSLTWTGHEYLDNIRDKSVWEKLKQSGLSSMSLDIAKDLAQEIITSIVKNKLHLE